MSWAANPSPTLMPAPTPMASTIPDAIAIPFSLVQNMAVITPSAKVEAVLAAACPAAKRIAARAIASTVICGMAAEAGSGPSAAASRPTTRWGEPAARQPHPQKLPGSIQSAAEGPVRAAEEVGYLLLGPPLQFA